MDLHNLLQKNNYLFSNTYYKDDGFLFLVRYLQDYANAHSWFHYYGTVVSDSDSDHYFHYVVIYWTEGHRPTLNTFNFIRNYD